MPDDNDDNDDKKDVPQVIRDGRFRPGHTVRGGRPRVLKELRDLIQQHGMKMAEHLIEIATGEATRDVIGPKEILCETPSYRDRIAASALLLAYGFGRPTETVEMIHQGSEPQRATLDLSKLSDEEILIMKRLATKAKKKEGE